MINLLLDIGVVKIGNMTKKFKKVPKTKGGIPKIYLKGAKNRKARENELKRTAELYRKGKLTGAMMDAISKLRSKG